MSKIRDFINNQANEEGIYDIKEILDLEKEIRADTIESIEKFINECKTNKAMDRSCDECKYSHHSYHQTCLEYVLEQLKEQTNDNR